MRPGVFLLLVTACASVESRPFGERRHAVLPPGVEERWFTTAPGGAAWAELRNRSVYLHHQGREFGPYT